MRTNRLATLATLILLGGSLASCDSFLDPDPTDVLTPENFYRTSADAVAAVNGVYEQVKWTYWLGFWYISDVATDDIVASANFGSDGHRMSNYVFDPLEWPPGGVWGDSYRTINRANAVLDRVPAIAMDTTLRNRLLGEAHFLRALAYFNLVRLFGDVPLFDHEVTTLKGVTVSRTPAADVYALIESDLQDAIAALPASYNGADIGRATNGAARALLAKVYLTRGDFANAAQEAGVVINSGRYTLLPDWHDIFRIATEITNSESIFEINYDATVDPGAGSVHTLFSLPSGYPGGDAYGLMFVPPSLVALFDTADVRGEGGTFMTSPFVNAAGDTVTWAMPPGPAFAKYLDQASAQNTGARAWMQQSNNWIVLRYADVLLMYAEAVNEGGAASAGTAENALNLVRGRAGLAAVSALSTAAFRDSVRLERRREFVFEGHRWFDLARWDALNSAILAKTTELQTLSPGETTVHGVPSNLMPIPQSEIDLNRQLMQNPGW